MKNITISRLSFIVVLLIFGCSQEHTSKKLSKNLDTSFLTDNNFIYKNVKSTFEIKFTGKTDVPNGSDVDNNLYADSTYKRKFVELTALQKTKLIAPFISKELNVNYKYSRDLMQAYFISKQKKIGDLQPIIIEINGDDYSSLTMIILNKMNVPVSGFNISGGMQSGPTEIGDSLISYDKKSYSYINDNKILTYRIRETDYTDSTKKDEIIDSNVFASTISRTGKFITKQVTTKKFTKSK
jgi:hypothetical protein